MQWRRNAAGERKDKPASAFIDRNRLSARLPELDGLRALAVISVILFHCEISGVFNAGFFGVDVFFAISGFIITAQLLKEYRETGGFKFGEFYFRRMKRLLPPMLGLILLSFLITPLVSGVGYARFRSDVPAALLYVSNWWQIWSRQPYFEAAEAPRMLTHLWSLAVEWQFYVAWPPLAYFFLKKFGRKVAGSLSLILALLSTAWMWHLYDGSDPGRVYLGTDTHAMGLLAGAALACFWNPWADKKEFSAVGRNGLRICASLSLALFGYMILVMNESDPFMYRGSFLLVPVLTCAIAYCTLNDPGFFLSRLLRTSMIQWIGSRSYSLYLVHWFIFTLMRLGGMNDLANLVNLAGGLLIIALISELTYQVLERRVIKMKLGQSGASKALAMGAYMLVVGAIFLGSIMESDNKGSAQIVASSPLVAKVAIPEGTALLPHENADKAAGAAVASPVETVNAIASGEHIYAIGDSVLLGASQYLSSSIPGIQIDAAIGRQASQGLKIVRELGGKPDASTVLLHLGTNGYINESQFKDLLRELANRKSVLVINVHANRRWTAPNNEIIERLAREFPNVHLINWHSISSAKPEYFVKDGIHLTKAGILALTAEIKVATGGTPIVAGSAAKREVSSASSAGQEEPRPAKITAAAEMDKALPTAEGETRLALSAIQNTDESPAAVTAQPTQVAGPLVKTPDSQ